MQALNDFVVSHIRTYVPLAVGAVITYLTVHGMKLDPATIEADTATLTALFSGMYYTLVRLLETKWPKLGLLLGNPTQPTYPITPDVQSKS